MPSQSVEKPVEENVAETEELSTKDMKIEELMRQLEELTETNKKLQDQVEKLEEEKRILGEANITLQGKGLNHSVIENYTISDLEG